MGAPRCDSVCEVSRSQHSGLLQPNHAAWIWSRLGQPPTRCGPQRISTQRPSAPKQYGKLTGGVGAEAPDLLGQLLVPAKLLRQDLGANLGVVTGAHLAVINGLSQAVLQGARLQRG